MQSRSPILSHRQWFHAAGTPALPLSRAFADRKPQANALAPLNRFPRMVREWYVEQVRAAEKIDLDSQAIKTKADAEGYVRGVREKIDKCFGKFPLNAKVTGKLERDASTST